MALKTTWNNLTTNKDDSAIDSDVYYLNGNSTNGRLNINNGVTWDTPRDLTVVYDGNTNHSYMKGHIKAKRLKFISKPNSNGRVDFQYPGWITANDMTYVYNGQGSIFTHLEPTGNAFGKVSFNVDMAGGNAYVQFAHREYPNVTLNIADTNNATINVYPARSHTNFTSFTGFKTINLTSLYLLKGSTSTSHGRFYDPEYVGQANNYLDIRQNTNNASNLSKEYFSLDLTAIYAEDLKVLVKDSANNEQFNLTCDNDNTRAKDWNNTPLSYYENKNVLLVHQRDISGSSSTRKQISYKIRRLGYLEINKSLFDMNYPEVIKEQKADEVYQNTTFDKTATTAQMIYDQICRILADDIKLDITYALVGNTIEIECDIQLGQAQNKYENNTLYLETLNYDDNITTTGEVINNGALITGTVVDKNKDFALFESNDIEFTVYTSADDRKYQQNPTATNVARFTGVVSDYTTLYVQFDFGDTLVNKDVSLEKGENVVFVGITGQIADMKADLNTIKSETNKITPAIIDQKETFRADLSSTNDKVDDVQTSINNLNVSGGTSENDIHDALDSYANKDDYKSNLTNVINAINGLNDISLANIEGSTVLAKESSIASLGSPLQSDDYVAPNNADITSIKATTESISTKATNTDAKVDVIKTKVDELENTDVTSLPTLAQIENSTILAKESTLGNIKKNTNLIPATL